MKSCQKIELWILSIPALVVAIGAIARYGAWRVLWVFPVGYTLASLTQFCKSMVYEVVDTPRTNACRAGKWGKAFGLVMLRPLYNWFVAAAFVSLTPGLFALAMVVVGILAVVARNCVTVTSYRFVATKRRSKRGGVLI